MQEWTGIPSHWRRRTTLLAALLAAAAPVIAGGCSKSQTTKVVYGTVTYQGQRVYTGSVRFVPIEGTQGPASRASIMDGQYKIDARGGVPLGKHRVEVNAQCKTGRKVLGRTVGDAGQIDELLTVGPLKYTGADSPIAVDVTDNSNGQIDIDIPAQ
jgi:hypothetical protein